MNMTPKDSPKRNILFAGYYDQFNTGDDAFCAVSAWGARHYWRVGNIQFLCRHIPQLTVMAKAALFARSFFRGQGLVELLVHLAQRPTVIFAGGSVFHNKVAILSYKGLIKQANRLRLTKLGGIGVSLGPYRTKNACNSIKDFLSRFSFLVLRDHRSYEEACSMNLPFKPVEGFDLAALLPDLYGPAKCSEKINDATNPVLGVSVCHYERYVRGETSNEKRREEQIIETLKMVSKSLRITIRFLVFNGHNKYGDRELTERIAGTLADYADIEIVPYSQNPVTMWHRIGECDAVLATRLHAGIYACFAEVPFLMVEYHHKCADFLQDIHYPSHWRIGDMEVSVNEVGSILISVLTKQTRPVLLDLGMFRARARRNFTEIDI